MPKVNDVGFVKVNREHQGGRYFFLHLFGLLMVIFFFFLQATTTFSEEKDYRVCMECHKGIERLDEDHAFACKKCHLLPKDRNQFLSTHKKVVRHPAAPEHMNTFCGECHQKEISFLRNSLHYTLAGMISQTRYLWGAQKDPAPRYSAAQHPLLAPLPSTPSEPKTPAELVDDFLRRRCFSCHLGQLPPQKKGFYRGLGCSACHIPYDEDGIYKGKDPTMRGKAGNPRKHEFAKPIPVKQCLHCHNGPRVGADYAGLFEHDYHWSYRTPWRGGSMPEPLYLMDHHRLRPDVHQRRGLICVDCHKKGDVMGRGSLDDHQKEAVGVRCQDCHGPFNTIKGRPEIASGSSQKRVFKDRLGREHQLPLWDHLIQAHNINEMKRLHCISCHSGWAFYDYGFSLIRDDRPDLSQWAPWRLQGDDIVASLFDNKGNFIASTGEAGPWMVGWRFRRWEHLILGVDSKDRIIPIRPHYQYEVSFVNKKGHVIMDNIIPRRGDGSGPGWAYMPFYPHTVQPMGRRCEACHGQALTAGKGLLEGRGKDLMLTRPSPPVYKSMRKLSEEEMKRLTKKPRLLRIRSRSPDPFIYP